MGWLEALFAFALTMIVFSTMVTAVMEIVHRLSNSREAGFELMARRIFDQVIWPKVQERLADCDSGEIRTAFVQAITRNPVLAERQPAGRGGWARVGATLASRVTPTTVAGMSVMEFVERIADTDVGRALAMEGKTYVSAAINDLAQKYDRFSEGAKQAFYNKARAWSVLASFAFAFAINVDAARLFQAYLSDQPLRQAVIDRQERVEQEMRAAQAALKEAQADAVADAAGKAELEKIGNRIEQLQTGFADLRTLGVPVGFDYYPWCRGKSSATIDSRCSPTGNGNGALQFVAWLLSVLLAGILIGLGAPFWFDLASGLSKGLRLLKAMGAGEKSAKGAASTTSTAATGADSPPRTPVEAFTNAIAAATVPSATRVTPSPAGEATEGE